MKLLNTSGKNAKNPSDIIKRDNTDISLIPPGLFLSDHNNKAVVGDNINNMDGIPSIPCNSKGSGNKAAPAIENENVNIISTGIVLILL